MQNLSGNPNISLEIKPEGDVEFWSHVTVVDGVGRTTFQQVTANATVINLGQLNSLKESILHVSGATTNVKEFKQGSITYTLLYDGSPGLPPNQSNSVGADEIKRGIFGFLLRFCPRHPFC